MPLLKSSSLIFIFISLETLPARVFDTCHTPGNMQQFPVCDDHHYIRALRSHVSGGHCT
jgi:hypothetical protein